MGWWPFGKPETRQNSGAGFQSALDRLIEASAVISISDVTSTAAVEAASGALSRAFASATVEAPVWVQHAVTPRFLAQVARDVMRNGESLHLIELSRRGVLRLQPCSQWHFSGSGRPESWKVRATYFGPSDSTTKYIPFRGVIFLPWGSDAGSPYTGTSPTQWASTTARLQAAIEKTLGDEALGPVAQLIAYPDDDPASDKMAPLRRDIASAKGDALFVSTTVGGNGEGQSAQPQKDWVPNRLGANPPAVLAQLQQNTFASVLASCGVPPGMFESGADGTSQREAVRRFHTNLVMPMAKILETELSEKLETEIHLTFDLHNADLVGRTQAFQKLVAGGVAVNEALITAGLLAAE